MKSKRAFEKSILSSEWKDITIQSEALKRYEIPVSGCDLIVYHRPGRDKTKKQHIIFYHGACGCSQMWENQYHAFENFDLYFVNVRGQGESSMKQGVPTYEDAIEDVHRMMSFFNMEKATLVGHSWGGNPLQEFVYRYPDKVNALVLIGSWGQHRIMSDKEKKQIKYSKIIYRLIPWKLVSQLNPKMCSDNFRTQCYIKKALLESHRSVFLNLGLSAYKDVRAIKQYKNNPPMLLVRGSEDFPKELNSIYTYLEEINPNARQAIIKNTKHQPMNDTPQELNDILNSFFEKVYLKM
ncbi:alpha/beta fold hydrolase [Staphylococcus ratti]|uniref:Alpha/beta hydrolase n=1 Tax=Staphylococcus ratti TaxID=2892440 RepID=A0ABY3PCL1_9STAP|nr:alpha/beta hydrolase [Staphylococcus ratti]UEX90063.1 alpha/beta hydrolase [Staphylococcus ratti]